MNKHLKVLVFLLVVVALGASFMVSTRFGASVTDPVAFAKCQIMDISKDGIVNSTDVLSQRNYMFETTKPKICINRMTKIPLADPMQLANCLAQDISKDGLVTGTDLIALRNYMDDPMTLKLCRTVASSSSSVSTCANPSSTDLATEMKNQIETRIAGVLALKEAKALFTTRGDATNPWVRSTSMWTARGIALDLTGASPWNSNGGYAKAGTLISPRHIVFAEHYKMPNGTTVLFVDKNNNVVQRTLQNQELVPGSTDLKVGILNADVPSSIAFYPVISAANITKYIGSPKVPMLILDQEDHAIIHDISSLADGFINHLGAAFGTSRYPFGEPLTTGDSGNPGFFVINNRLALGITHMTSTTGPFLGSYIDAINQTMTNLGGGYHITEFDTSCFTPKT